MATALIISNTSYSSTTDSESATNAGTLGSINNEARPNLRIDDIFGYVSYHMPPLWQVPYRIGVDNTEVEVLLLCIGRGQYYIPESSLRDGDTLISDISGAGISIYAPGTHPGNGDPEIQVGTEIDEELGIYSESNELNSAELEPPNDLSIGDAEWSFTEVSDSVGKITLTNADDLDIDLTDYIGDDDYYLSVTDSYVFDEIGTFTVYTNTDGTGARTFDWCRRTTLLGDYYINSVSSDYVLVDLDGAFDSGSWDGLSNYVPVEESYNAIGVNVFDLDEGESPTIGDRTYTLDEDIDDGTVYYDSGGNEITTATSNLSPGIEQLLDGTIGPFTVTSGATEMILNFVSTSGYYDIKDGNDISRSANIEVTVEETDEDGVPTGEEWTYTLTYSSNSDNISSPVFHTERIGLPDYDYMRVSAVRTTYRVDSDSVSNMDSVTWRDLYFFEPIDDDIDFGDVTLAHVYMTSNTKSQLIKERKINMDVTRKITQYLGDEEFGDEESYATDQFDQILIHMALDPRIGRLSLDEINADGFMDLCDEIKEYFDDDDTMTTFGYDFDDTQTTFQDSFAIVGDAVNCLPYVQNGVYDMFFEKLQESSDMQITHRNKIAGTEIRTTTFRRKYDGVELTYRDRDSGCDETIYIPTDQSAYAPESTEKLGVTTELQAYRRALRMYYKQIHNTDSVVFDVDEFGRLIVPGQRIDSPDGTRFTKREGVDDGYQVYDGEIVEVDGLNVELSQPVEFTDDEDHYIQFTNSEGDSTDPILCTATDNERIITLQSLPTESLYEGYQRDKTKFVFCSEQLRESIPLIPQTIEFSLDNGEEVNTITSINYSDRYYDGDQETV